MTEHLLAPVKIGSMTVANRIAMAPMGVEIVGDDGMANDEVIAYYEARAAGGAGLLITEVAAFAYPHGANSVHQLAMSDDRYIPALRKLTDAVHRHGAKIAVQLVHHGKISRVDVANGDPVYVPSLPEWHGSLDMINDLSIDELMAMAAAPGGADMKPQFHAMTTDEIAAITEQLGDAVVRAQAPGSTPSRFTAPTAISSPGSCRASGTGATTSTAVRSRTEPGSCARSSPKRNRAPVEISRSGCASMRSSTEHPTASPSTSARSPPDSRSKPAPTPSTCPPTGT